MLTDGPTTTDDDGIGILWLTRAPSAQINPLVTFGLSHPYHLDEATFMFRGITIKFSFLFHFSMKFI